MGRIGSAEGHGPGGGDLRSPSGVDGEEADPAVAVESPRNPRRCTIPWIAGVEERWNAELLSAPKRIGASSGRGLILCRRVSALDPPLPRVK